MPFSEFIMKAVGIIHTPFKNVSDNVPVQGRLRPGIEGRVEIFPEYRDACRDLHGFYHLFLVYNLGLSTEERLMTKPYMDTIPRGIFSTRSPHRPNHIGLSLVTLVNVEPGMLVVRDVDMLDGTPLLDIKPYNPLFDALREGEALKTGWMRNISAGSNDRGILVTRSKDEWLQVDRHTDEMK